MLLGEHDYTDNDDPVRTDCYKSLLFSLWRALDSLGCLFSTVGTSARLGLMVLAVLDSQC